MAGIDNLTEKQTAVNINDDPKRLFVYGSFLDGFFNYKKCLEGRVVSRVQARVRGSLFHQNNRGFPAMVHGDGWVSGEFLELEDFDALILKCDIIEEYYGPNCPDNMYERRITETMLADGSRRSAWVYWYSRGDLGSRENPVIPVLSGDWREFTKTL